MAENIKTVYIHLAPGFEEIEALTCADWLRRAGIDAKLVSVTGERTVTGVHDIVVQADLLFEEAEYDRCEMIILPGGMPGAVNLEAHEGLGTQIKDFAKAGKLLAAICAAPLVFAAHGVLEGKEATIYPGMEDRLRGAVATGENVTVCGNVITGAGPDVASEFALTLIDVLKGEDAKAAVAEDILFNRR
ncbi:MAG: DJ-1 family glyoxalase III [Lentihominibacter sp.]